MLAGFAVTSSAAAPAPKLAILIAGIGYAETPSLTAVQLPAAVGLALSPYGAHIQRISEAARKTGHELIMALPMQPSNITTTSEGKQALDPDARRADSQRRLDWALAQATGYDGVTNALGTANGGGFMQRRSALAWLGKSLATHHLFFIDAFPEPKPPILPGQTASVLIDPNQGVAAARQALAQLIVNARATGSALGVITEPAPRTLALLGPWLQSLSGSGVTLVPVRDLVITK